MPRDYDHLPDSFPLALEGKKQLVEFIQHEIDTCCCRAGGFGEGGFCAQPCQRCDDRRAALKRANVPRVETRPAGVADLMDINDYLADALARMLEEITDKDEKILYQYARATLKRAGR
jgi:hypothetical protein